MINLFFGGEQFKTSFGNEFGNIELDANLEETHEWQAEPTNNPVENGADITDHIIESPDKLTIRGFVTDAPLNGIMGNIIGFINAITGNGGGQRTKAVFDLLRRLIKEKQPLVVVTKYHIYTGMVLTGISIPRSAAVGEAVEFIAQFQHIRTVSTQLVAVPKGISEKKAAKSDVATGIKSELQKKVGQVQAIGKVTEKAKSVLSTVGGGALKAGSDLVSKGASLIK
jgi:hypothetical protein